MGALHDLSAAERAAQAWITQRAFANPSPVWTPQDVRDAFLAGAAIRDLLQAREPRDKPADQPSQAPAVVGQYKHQPITIGMVFGRYTVTGSAPPYRQGAPRVECTCSCGQVKQVGLINLVNGGTSSCGCLRSEVSSKRNRSAPADRMFTGSSQASALRFKILSVLASAGAPLDYGQIADQIKAPEPDDSLKGRAYFALRALRAMGLLSHNSPHWQLTDSGRNLAARLRMVNGVFEVMP